MRFGGWVMLLISWAVILVLVIFCYRRIIKTEHPHMRAPLEIDTEEDQ